VTALEDEHGKIYVGLPPSAAQALEELRQQGKIGYELSVEFHARILVGAYVIYKKKTEATSEGSEQEEEQQESDQESSENAA
ncbi:MAG: hypothetical protein ACOX87_16290, partial [Chloroflexota bacterium]